MKQLKMLWLLTGRAQLSWRKFSEVTLKPQGAWYIWWQRRELVNGEKVAPLDRIAFSIQALAANYRGAQTLAVPKELVWQRPQLSSYKLNIDACFIPNGSGAAGAILQNSNGQAVAGASWELNNMLDATTTEAVALQRGLQFIEQIGCSSVIIESDSLQLVQAFNGVIVIWSSPYTAILADCFQRVRRIGHITVQNCFREANSVAHKLARVSFDSKNFIFWDCDPPSFIIPDVTNDVNLFDLQ
jgi:ribonuclease HI